MDLQALLPSIATVEPLAEVYARLDAGAQVTLGVTDASKAVVTALLWRRTRRTALLLVARESDAEAYAEQLAVWSGAAALHFPARGGLPYSREVTDSDVTQRRIAALSAIARASASDRPPLIVASVAAAAEHTMRPADLGRGAEALHVGDRLALDEFAVRLVEAGYEVLSLVEQPGQAARRGGLIDVYPPAAEAPVRIEFFGSEVESIRSFDVETQRTIERLESIEIGPATEWFPAPASLIRLAGQLDETASEAGQADLHMLRAGELPFPARYGPLVSTATILDHLGPEALLILDERELIEAASTDLDELTKERRDDLAGKGELDRRAPLPHEPHDALLVALERHTRRVELARWATGNEPGAFRLPFTPSDGYAGRLPAAAQDAVRQLRRGDRVIVATQQAQRYAEVLAEHGVDVAVHAALDRPPDGGSLSLVQGALPEGWTVSTASGIVSLVTDRELFGFVRKRRTLRRRAASHRSQFLAEVAPGDFVVHSEHGIARFGGIVRREVDGKMRDYLELRYAGDDRLYVPSDQVDRVSRFTGPSERPPRLTRLGTQEWTRARARVRAAVSIVAADLARLYAARQLLAGHAFSADTEWQRELEASFPYEETADQLTAISAVKADMEREQPMDRIICGDVGFGKTEVALRAAFKAVQDGYQVAVLVPTTVLAQQHLRTFRERLSAFPVSVEVLSRFRSDAEAADVIARVRRGEVDILIGTHRLLYPSVQFANLGLVVVDEEQRFGVTHKERLKRLRLEVDVLTLSATPIPRTMHMAISGIRDMSTIDTAPQGRQPVQTYVMEWDESIAREAILHEMERGGQVYLLHNRVKSIDQFADRIRALVPEANVVVGHGQMPESILQRVMERFAEGEFDVLVCTTIIESGLDIPNVNTLLVDRADRLGLAQLYQLRGRVGRAAHQAFAYLFYPRDRVLTTEAQQRLSTIFEANELGAGFQVALRDLEIRGAGNLLGAEQSGSIAAVGFDLFTQMLAEAVEELRESGARDGKSGETPAPPRRLRESLRRIAVDLPAVAFIPESYIEEIEGRLALYQRIAAITTSEQATELGQETADRFGALPDPLATLFTLVRIRVAAMHAGVRAMRLDGADLLLTAADGRPFASRRLPELPPGVQIGRTQIRLPRRDLGEDWLPPIEALLGLLAGDREPVPA